MRRRRSPPRGFGAFAFCAHLTLRSQERAARTLRKRLDAAARVAAKDLLEGSDAKARKDAHHVCAEIKALRKALDASSAESAAVRNAVQARAPPLNEDDPPPPPEKTQLDELVAFNQTIHAFITELAAD